MKAGIKKRTTNNFIYSLIVIYISGIIVFSTNDRLPSQNQITAGKGGIISKPRKL